jgi:hypothetical protein
MLDITYTKLSNYLKIGTLIVGATLSVIQNPTDLVKLATSNTLSITAVALILMTMLDRLHKETILKLTELTQRLQENFEYNGLINSPKEKFSAGEMVQIWPLIVSCVKREFASVNYLSPRAWKESGGHNLIAYLGSKKRIIGFQARRIFVVESITEVAEWRETAENHTQFDIEYKFILKTDFDKLRADMTQDDDELRKTCGFNVIDTASPGLVLDWRYKDRKQDGARLKRGKIIAEKYITFFNFVWASQHCKAISDIDN